MARYPSEKRDLQMRKMDPLYSAVEEVDSHNVEDHSHTLEDS